MEISLLGRGGTPSASGRNDDAAETRKAKSRIEYFLSYKTYHGPGG
jgi:hypothetical protein